MPRVPALAGSALLLAVQSHTFAADADIPAGTVLQNISLPTQAIASPDDTAPGWLAEHGIFPTARLQESLFTSHSLGVQTGKTELISSYSLGLELDLSKLLDIPGGALHIETVRNYGRSNNAVGGTVGAYPLAQIPQNAPKRDVPVFTYEQRLLGNRLDLEVGRKNVVWFFIDEFSMWENFSRLTQYTWLVLPPPYATWSARAKYRFSEHGYLQAGAWEYNTGLWGLDGWNWRTTEATGVTSLLTLGYADRQGALPAHAELTGYYLNAPEDDPYYTVAGTSQVLNSSQAAQRHKGANGLIASAGKVVQRFDAEQALYLFASAGANNSTWINSGVSADAYAGASWLNPFGRHDDVLGVKVEYNRLSARKHKLLEDANLASGGSGYSGGRDSQFVELFAHLNLGRYLSIDPYLAYGFNANTAFDPYTAQTSHDGWVFGTVLTFNLGALAGLPAPRMD